jgi:hypothetical protein
MHIPEIKFGFFETQSTISIFFRKRAPVCPGAANPCPVYALYNAGFRLKHSKDDVIIK